MGGRIPAHFSSEKRRRWCLLTYYICEVCGLYHTGRRPPKQCKRCGSAELEKVQIADPDFNAMMKAVQTIGRKN